MSETGPENAPAPDDSPAPEAPFPEATFPEADSALRTVPWNRLRIEPGHNPRGRFDGPAIDRLAATIRERGLLQPLVVRPGRDGGFVVVAGERRHRAIGRLIERGAAAPDLPVPVRVRQPSRREALLDALIENGQREGLEPLEEAAAFARLRDEHGMTTAEIAAALGVSRRTVQLRLQLLQLAPEVRAAFDAGEIPVRVARVLAGAPAGHQVEALERYRAGGPERRTAAAVRADLRSRMIPYSRALFDPRSYSRAHGGTVFDAGRAGKYFADAELFLRLQRDALADLLAKLEAEHAWVEVVQSRRLPPAYREAEDGPGAVVLLKNGPFDVATVRPVRRVEPGGAPEPGEPEETRPPAAARPPRPPAGRRVRGRPRGPRRSRQPSRRPPRVALRELQEAVAGRPETALRLAITALLSPGARCGLRLEPPPAGAAATLGPRVAGPLQAVARALGLGSSSEELLSRLADRADRADPDDPADPLPDAGAIYRALARFPAPTLQRIHAALVALGLASGDPDSHPPAALLARVAETVGMDAVPERTGGPTEVPSRR